jgi:outer membrane protein assembly factor BamB
MTDNAAPAANEASTNNVNDLIGLAVAFTAVVAIGLLLAAPWVVDSSGGMLTRYAPLRDGAASLLTEYDTGGTLVGWQSNSTTVLNKARALAGQLRPAVRDAIVNHFGQVNAPASGGSNAYLAQFEGMDFLETRQTMLRVSGTLKSSSIYSVRDDRGEWLVGLYDPQQVNPDTIFSPPILSLPSNLSAGHTWETAGTMSNGLSYRYEGRVISSGAYSDTAHAYGDCVQLETTFSLSKGARTNAQPDSALRYRMWYCNSVGLVGERDFDAQGNLTARFALIAGGEIRPELSQLPPASLGQAQGALRQAQGDHGEPVELHGEPVEPPPAPDFAQWRYTRVARLGQEVADSSGTIPPTWVPANPPLVLTAGYNGDLTAFDGSDPSGVVVWTFHTQGTIYSPPAYDASRNRVYFGSTDKRLYALDARGLFLWSFETGDSIATRPIVISDTVIFGSEDRTIYGLDAGTGVLRWKVRTGGAVVSSPVAVGDHKALAVIGSDDGGVYALDASTGEQQWLFITGDAVEAPLAAWQDMVYVASRDNSLYAIDSLTGQAVWSADVGEVLRNAPAVDARGVYVVDEAYRLHAFDRGTGKQLWSTVEEEYAGTPVLLGGALLVAGHDGNVYRLGLDGTRTGQWQASDAAIPSDPAPRQVTSPALGGDGALWLTDDGAVIRRLGAPSAVAALRMAWEKNTTDPVFKSYLYGPAVAYKGQALLLDGARQVLALNPATGDIQALGTLDVATGATVVEPTVSGDTLLAPVGNALYAVHLPDMKPLWQVKTGGLSLQPAVVAGDVALLLAETTAVSSTAGAPKHSTLYAIDLSSGAVRWQQAGSGYNTLGGVTADTSRWVAYVSTPPAAFDLRTGKRLWLANPQGLATGGAALSPQGDTLYVGLYDPLNDTGSLAALNTADGHVRWQTPLGKDVLATLDRPWISGSSSSSSSSYNVIVPLLGGAVVALDASDGHVRWQHKDAQLRFGNIAVIDGLRGAQVWLALQNGDVLALDATTGNLAARSHNVAVNLSSYNFSQHPLLIGDRLVVVLGLKVIGLEIAN